MSKEILRVHEVSKLFGPHAEQGIPLLKQGYTKERLLKEKGITIGVGQVSLDIREGKFSSSWACPAAANRRLCGC